MKEKSIAKNVVFNVLYRFMNMFFPLITSVYVSHILGASGIGKVGISQNIAQYFVLIAPLGLLNYGTREIAKVRTDEDKCNKWFTELFLINLVSTIVCTSVYYCMIMVGGYFQDERLLFLITGLTIIFNVINVEWYYQGKEEFVYISIRSILVKTVSLILMLIFVRESSDYRVYAFIYTLGIAGNNVFNVINLKKNGVRLVFDKLEIVKHLKPIFILLASTIAIELYTLLDTTMLGAMCSDEIVGYYSNAMKLDRIVVGLISAIGAVLLPRFSYYIKNNRIDKCNELLSVIVRVMAFFSIPCGIGMMTLANTLVPLLFGDSFIPAIITTKIGTALIYVLALSNLFGTQVLLSFAQEKKLLLCTLVGALSNFVMNAMLIPLFGNDGAAVASVVSEFLVAIMSYVMARKYVRIDFHFSFWSKTIVSGVVMGIIVSCISRIINYPVISVVLSVLIGVISYIGINIILRNPFIKDIRLIKNSTKGEMEDD